ncbi:MAG: hypothetical protein KIG96_03220 [Treponema sp.]|nr:hypothetical protein [Treponema sp.]
MKVGIFGEGYVGYSLALLLSETEDVTLIDVDDEKIQTINNNIPCLGEVNLSYSKLSSLNIQGLHFKMSA